MSAGQTRQQPPAIFAPAAIHLKQKPRRGITITVPVSPRLAPGLWNPGHPAASWAVIPGR